MRLLAQHVLVVWILLLACSSGASAQGVIDMGGMPEQESKAHFKVGKSLYESGRFAEAAVEWNRAFELSQRVELLYNVYVAYRDASDVPRAIDALRRYLQGAELDDATRQNLQARLRAMEEANGKAPVVAVTPSETPSDSAASAPAPAEQPAADPAPAEPSPASAPAQATTSTSDDPSIAPYVLLGVGGALAIGAAVTGLIVSGNEKDLEDDCPDLGCSGDNADKLESTRTLAVVTDVLWISGVVAAGMGTALLLFGGDADAGAERDAAASTRPVASLGCAPGSCAASLRGRF
jgi:tetratricopeptide (TPR) repeat protein